MTNFLTKALAALLLSALVVASVYYPMNKGVIVLGLGAYAAVLWKYPHGWLLAVPALLPILDFAPWTGWFFLDELDLVLLLTAAVAYWRLGAAEGMARQSRFFLSAFALVGVAFAIATVIGITPLTSLTPNSFANYTSNYNGLRIAKGFGWALILVPLLRTSAGPGLVNLRRLFVPGMLLGLAGACLAVVWERAVFPGLLDFASDYRPTAPFSAMHTGGAALDAYLAISFPFVVFWLIGNQSRVKTVLALLLLLLGCFAGMATFSRDVYMAYGVSAAGIGALALMHGVRRQQLRGRAIVAIALLLALSAYALTQVFSTSGYRGLAAALALLGAAVVFGATAPQRVNRPLLVATAALLAVLDTGLFLFLSANGHWNGIGKGPYLGFIVSTACFCVAAMTLVFGSSSRQGHSFTIAAGAFPCMALTTVFIAYHWGGDAALGDAALAVALAIALAVLNRLMRRPLWTLGRSTLTFTFVCGIILATLVPLAGSYYLGARFATVGDDLAVRLRHWSEAIDIMTPDLATSAFGMGLGRYPETYMWKNTHGEMPGTFSYETEGGHNVFLRLTGPQYSSVGGEVVRMLQHVKLNGATGYVLALDARRTNPKAGLHIAICERWLLYPQNCMAKPITLGPPDGVWHHYEIVLSAGALARPSGLPHATTQLEMSTDSANASVDLDNVSVRDVPTGSELIRNGSFSYSNDHWFFSSDRNHFPWHVKNFLANMFFEQGWFGLGAIALLLCYVTGDLLQRAMQGATDAAIYLAAIAGFMVVGIFDSLFDVPRLTLLFMLVLAAANLRMRPRPTAPPLSGAGRLDRVARQQVVHGRPADTQQL